MRAFFGAVIAIGIAAVAGGLFCAVYTVGEYIVETEYEKRYQSTKLGRKAERT